jgi:putative flippase GtrA
VNDDWADFLQSMLDARARFLVVGAHALAVHGVPRATQDLDVWIARDPSNMTAVVAALAASARHSKRCAFPLPISPPTIR